MAEKMFSKKEAISHGLKITRKYFGFILLVYLVYAVFQGVSGFMGYMAGGPVTRPDVSSLYKDSSDGDYFYVFLKEKGYIDNDGNVGTALQELTGSPDLVLSERLEPDRSKIFEFLNAHRYRLPFPKPAYYVLAIIFWVVGMIMGIGVIKISLMLSRDQKPEISELFSNGSLIIKYLVAVLCVGLASLIGFILLIVPGIIVSVMLSMAKYFVVDKEMGPIASLRASQALTKGARWQLFVFGAVMLLFNIAGLLCLVIGLLVTIPASSIAAVYVYDQLSKYKSEGAV